MYFHYFYWQYIVAPLWILQFLWTANRALVRFFSVPLLLKTLFAHWHKDRVSYRSGTITGLLQAATLNGISRGIGFVVRVLALSFWFMSELLVLGVGGVVFIIFIILPLLVMTGFAYGFTLAFYG